MLFVFLNQLQEKKPKLNKVSVFCIFIQSVNTLNGHIACIASHADSFGSTIR